MKSFSNVLWATDGKSEDKLVIKRVLAVIKKFNSRLTLIHVIEELPSELSILSSKRRSEINKKRKEYIKLQETKSRASLQKIVATLKNHGIDPTPIFNPIFKFSLYMSLPFWGVGSSPAPGVYIPMSYGVETGCILSSSFQSTPELPAML